MYLFVVYRVTQKEWDCKDDLKLFYLYNSEKSYVVFCLEYNLFMIRQKEKQAGNHEHKKKESMNSAQPSLKSHSLLVTLYIK